MLLRESAVWAIIGKSTRLLSSTVLPFCFRVPLLRPNSRKKGALLIKGLLRNLESSSPRLQPVADGTGFRV